MHTMKTLAVGAAALLASAIATAIPPGLFISGSVTLGPATCTATGISSPTSSGTVTANLLDIADNAYIIVSVNGTTVTRTPVTIPGPFPTTTPPSPGIVLPLEVATTPPYVVVESEFPAAGGVPTGTGITLTGTCNADGTASIAFVTGVPAPAALAVPALSPSILALLASVLALTAFAGLRRSGRP